MTYVILENKDKLPKEVFNSECSEKGDLLVDSALHV
jgi:hypothetical protein